ncbi:Lipid-A-disaccharide synthase [Chlamydiales bacterium STE3]|nr:Lipid-A-disaccharide synthase [Chlamydiales bacterium STE3]
MAAHKLFIFAGEASGDLHGQHLLNALCSINSPLDVSGVGGQKMRSTGMQCVMPTEKFQVMGFSDVFSALPRLMRQFYQVRNAILKTQPHAVVLIDYPGFNLRLAKSLRKKGFKNKIIHYIAPTVWAWRKGRIKTMVENLDLLLTIFPFETAFFSQTPLRTEYVGNPLISELSRHTYHPDWKKNYALNGETLALFPGSRPGDIQQNLPVQIQTAMLLKKQFPLLKPVISCAHEDLKESISHIAKKHGLAGFTLISERYNYDLMKDARLALSKSGTATLELALHGCPTVVTYQLSKFNYFVAKHLVKINLPHYCIANILLNETLFPEIIGPNLSPNAIARQATSLMDENYRTYTKAAAIRLKQLLTEQDASLKAALAIRKILE